MVVLHLSPLIPPSPLLRHSYILHPSPVSPTILCSDALVRSGEEVPELVFRFHLFCAFPPLRSVFRRVALFVDSS